MEYVEVTSSKELDSLMSELSSQGRSYYIIAGATDAMITWKRSRSFFNSLDYVVDVSNAGDMKSIEIDGGVLRIGASVTIEDLKKRRASSKEGSGSAASSLAPRRTL